MGQVRVLVGAGPAQVTPAGRRSRGAVGLARTLGAARFAFASDGRALLVAAPGHVAGDLTPLAGRWWADGDAIALEVARSADPYRRVAVSGRVHAGGFAGRHEMVDGDDVHVHDVTVALDDRPEVLSAAGARWVGDVPVPVSCRGELTGECDGEPVGPAPVELALVDPVAGAREPLEIHLASTEPGAPGSVLWCSGTTGLTAEDTGRYTVTVRGPVVTASADSDTGTALGITLDVPLRPPPGLREFSFGFTATVPVPARRARLHLGLTRRGPEVEVIGRLEVTVRHGGREVALTGRLRARGALPAAADLDTAGFERCWADAGGPG